MHVPAGWGIAPDTYRRAKALPQYAKALAGWGLLPMHVSAGWGIAPDTYRRAKALPQYAKALAGWGGASFSKNTRHPDALY